MKPGEILHIKTLSHYYTAAGWGKPRHPLISIYPFKDAPKIDVPDNIKFTLGYYVVTIKYQCSCKSQYGQTNYDYDEGVMGFTAPHQLIGIDKNFELPTNGWCLMFHPDLIRHSGLLQKIKGYDFFDYDVNEALILSEDEERDIEELFQKIRQELYRPVDNFSHDVLIAQLDLLLTYSNRFYNRQFITRKPLSHNLLARFEALLDNYFSDTHTTEGLPSIGYFANQLNLSPKYFSDMLKQLTGLTAQQHIHQKLIDKAKEKLSATTLSVSEIAYALGFEHSPSFSKFFKAKTQQSPLEFRASF